MEPWTKKRKLRDLFTDLEDMVDSLIGELEKDIDRREFSDKPLLLGFSLRMDPHGRPVIEEFGNVKRKGRDIIKPTTREPLVDIQEEGRLVTITAELPGAEKKNIQIKTEDNRVIIDVKGENQFYKEVTLDTLVLPKSAKAKFKNGILELSLRKAKYSH